MKIRNVSGQDREVPILHRVVEADAVTEVPEHLVDSFICQPEIWEAAEPDFRDNDNDNNEGQE